MKIIPAVDIKNGKAVRLYQGNFDIQEIVGGNPVEIVEGFIEKGINEIHIVDLDGALGDTKENRNTIEKICSLGGAKIQLGGGIKTVDDFKRVMDLGVDRVVIGSMIVKNFEIFQKIANLYRESVVAGIDISDGRLMVTGWLEGSKINPLEISKKIEELKIKRMVVTDISRDGTMKGLNTVICKAIKQFYSGEIIGSGGVSSVKDIEKARLEGLDGVIIGKSLYKGKITIEDIVKGGI